VLKSSDVIEGDRVVEHSPADESYVARLSALEVVVRPV
jgi:hypothetical protein